MMLIVYLLIIFCHYIVGVVVNFDEVEKTMVFIKPFSAVKFFNVPISDKPVISWMDIRKGIYPNTTEITSMVMIGEPITILIYFQDRSYLYDFKVTDCWAYDKEDFENSMNKLHLMENNVKKKTKLIDKWTKVEFPRYGPWKTMLYATLNSFKFPEQQQIFITCDIELCYKSCNKQQRNTKYNPLHSQKQRIIEN